MKVNIKKIWAIIIFIWLFVLLILLSGCKTKKKVIDRQKQSVEKHTNETVNEITNNDILLDSFAKTGSGYIITDNIKTIDLTQADINKTITIEDSKGFKLTIKGANAVIKNSIKKETKQDSSLTGLSKIDKSKIDKSETKRNQEKIETVHRNSNSDVHTTSTWLWVGIGIGLLAFIFIFRKKLLGLV